MPDGTQSRSTESMRLVGIVDRARPPEPWQEGDNIPWHEPGFSQRMLREHLTQEHDAASRRTHLIDQAVAWMHSHLLRERPSRVLDLGCGPGLYASRLARLGHTCLGIDYSPASIAYAKETAVAEGLACEYLLQDVRQANFGDGYDLATLIYGELNIFRPRDARLILHKMCAALRPGGTLVLEPHTYEAAREQGQRPATWFTSNGGLFSERPHLCLTDRHWDDASQTSTLRYYVVDAGTGEVTRFAQTFQAYTETGYRELLQECSLSDITFYPSLIGDPDPEQPNLFAIVAHRPGRS